MKQAVVSLSSRGSLLVFSNYILRREVEIMYQASSVQSVVRGFVRTVLKFAGRNANVRFQVSDEKAFGRRIGLV